MSRIWIVFLLKHAALIGVGGLIGALYNQTLTGVLVATLGLLAWHITSLYRLAEWLRSGKLSEPPSGNGIWSRVFAQVDFIRQQEKSSRKKWRRLLKELRASTKNFPDGGVLLNKNYEILNQNKAARQLLGLKKKRDKGQRVDNLIRHPDFVAYLEQGLVADSVEIPSPVNGDLWLSCRLIVFGPDQYLLLVQDITPAKKIETMRQDFVANASHELRSPLTVISGYLELLSADDSLPGDLAQPVAAMSEQAERMNNLVRDLLQLSSLESLAPCSTDKSVDIGGILASAHRMASALDEHPETIDLRVESDVQLLGEETEIQSVVTNLVNNAIRYTPRDGSIELIWRVDEQDGQIIVRDSGIGIASDDIPRLTERFYRADDGRARQQGGTGLGLAIVKHALTRHDARLEIQSEPGTGSTFICHFPKRRLARVA
jgi:two-component system phosphate regulon sensor histidine kinase PhoR